MREFIEQKKEVPQMTSPQEKQLRE
jgi:hypothetical protein